MYVVFVPPQKGGGHFQDLQDREDRSQNNYTDEYYDISKINLCIMFNDDY